MRRKLYWKLFSLVKTVQFVPQMIKLGHANFKGHTCTTWIKLGQCLTLHYFELLKRKGKKVEGMWKSKQNTQSTTAACSGRLELGDYLSVGL